MRYLCTSPLCDPPAPALFPCNPTGAAAAQEQPRCRPPQHRCPACPSPPQPQLARQPVPSAVGDRPCDGPAGACPHPHPESRPCTHTQVLLPCRSPGHGGHGGADGDGSPGCWPWPRAPRAPAAGAGTAQAKQGPAGSVCGQAAGKHSAEPFNQPVMAGGATGHPAPGLAGQDTLLCLEGSKGMSSHLSAVTNHFSCPSATEGTPPCPNEALSKLGPSGANGNTVWESVRAASTRAPKLRQRRCPC